VINQSTPQADPPAMATDGANTIMDMLNSKEQSELQPTPLPISIVSQQDPATTEENHPLVICPQGGGSPLRT